jgi:pseudouridine synthase
VIRLQKALADRGVASRRKAEELIVGGRVSVDGETVTTLGTKVRPDARIDVDGAPTRQAKPRYVVLNKPLGVVSTAGDERGRKTVVELIGAPERLYPVGRLDTDSEGLLLLTNDGDWAERVLHPRYGHEREYDVSVRGELTPAAIAQLQAGIRLEEGLAIAERVEIVTRSRSASRVRVVLHTGWRRQVRRMLAAIGLKVTRLVRVRIGRLPLGKLRTGEWRDLTAKEIADLARPAAPKTRPVVAAKMRPIFPATTRVAAAPAPKARVRPPTPGSRARTPTPTPWRSSQPARPAPRGPRRAPLMRGVRAGLRRRTPPRYGATRGPVRAKVTAR